MTVTYSEYITDRRNFFRKHDNDFRVQTSGLDEYARYTKTYIFEDGAMWYELMGPEYVTTETEVKLVKVKIDVKMYKTEYWSSESPSKYYYEKY